MATAAKGVLSRARKSPEWLCSELQSCWNTLAAVTETLYGASTPLRNPPVPAPSLEETLGFFRSNTEALLVSPVEQLARSSPLQKSIEALRDCDSETGANASRSRAGTDARFQSLLAKTAIDLCEPWRIWRSGGQASEWSGWDKRRSLHAQQASELLKRYTRWAAKQEIETKSAIESPRSLQRRQIFWRQQRSVEALLTTEVALRNLAIVWLQGLEQLVVSLRREREQILALTQQTALWIEQGALSDNIAPFENLQLSTPEERLRSWMQSLEKEAESRLLDNTELVRPGRWPRWSSVKVKKAFLSAVSNTGHDSVRAHIREYCERNAMVLREVARSREIVTYWSAAAETGGNSDALFAEAKHNASTVLLDQLQTPATSEELEPKLVRAFWEWLEESSTAVEAEQSGWIALTKEARGRRVLRRTVGTGGRRAHQAATRAGRWTSDRWERALESIGGRIPARPTAEPVVRRATLRDTLALPAHKGDLPALYGLLFRLAPVDDRRFLVGRDQELTGFEQAVQDWEAGRFAACLFVGARGSGKTSLLNCASSSIFAGRQVVRGQFSERALTPEAIDRFLCRNLRQDDAADLITALQSKPRILIIEESERCYLRRVGGFDGAVHLLSWISRTATSTLWIVVMNDRAFRVLEAGAGFGRAFSHRINAMSVSRKDLELAILERHRLSGLRLEFAPPPLGDPRVSRAKRWFGLEESPQKLFFDSIYQQSGGVFRSAFELWLSSIERVEGETLKMRHPLEPAFNRFRRELAQDDQFTLLAIEEHGSLTPSELAEVLLEGEEIIQGRLNRLSALGLIELDPDHGGWRVRPEAERFTSDLLKRVNLV